MVRTLYLLTATAFLAIAFLIVPNKARALPDGVSVDLIAEYTTEVSDLEKILFRKITIKPGASWSLTVPDQSVCEGTKGVLEITNKTSGKTTIHKAGDRWSTVAGDEVTLTSKGTEDHEHLFYTLVRKK